MAQRDARVDVAIGYNLALLGQFQTAVDRAAGLGHDRPRHGPSPATNGAAAAMEQGQLHPVTLRNLDQRSLRLEQHPRRGESTRFLGRV